MNISPMFGVCICHLSRNERGLEALHDFTGSMALNNHYQLIIYTP